MQFESKHVVADGTGESPPDAGAARRRLLADHRETLAAVVDAADEVAGDWPDGVATRRSAVSGPLRAAIDQRDLAGPLLDALADAVTAAGRELSAQPVPHPPYLTVNGRGPLLRATVDDGRILVALAVFTVERDPVRYVRSGETPEAILEVTVKQ